MSTQMPRFVFACSRPWGLEAFQRHRPRLPGQWTVVTAKADLSLGMLQALQPRYVFFPHWSWIVPDEITKAFECVCFHMTDVPFGRGGSPLQNLIARGMRETRLSALRMTSRPDAGPVYEKRPLDLSGSAEEIYRRAMEITLDSVAWIVEAEPEPVSQSGEVTVFPRRRPEQSALPVGGSLESIYDHIRMLDAPGYPHAFVDHGSWRLTMTGADREDDHLVAQVRITRRETEDDGQ